MFQPSNKRYPKSTDVINLSIIGEADACTFQISNPCGSEFRIAEQLNLNRAAILEMLVKLMGLISRLSINERPYSMKSCKIDSRY